MASLIEQMYESALGIVKLTPQEMAFALGYLASYDPNTFKAVMDATMQQRKHMEEE